ncbi:MAG: type 1 glutamine amidotransferase [Bacteroidota bacterium]
MTSILILEGNTANLVDEARARNGVSPAQMYELALKSQAPDIQCNIKAPYECKITDENLDDIDWVVLTGSGVPWSVDDPQARPLREAVTKVFERGIPTLASCNGMQLGAVILGGKIGVSPNGMEVGLALEIDRTSLGKGHSLLHGRTDGYAVPCAHRDEVQELPNKALHLAGNAHSPIQAFAYERGGVSFWGVQYHPEFTAAWVADLMRAPGTLWQNSTAANLLDIADTDKNAAKQLGAGEEDLTPEVRVTEIRNWLAHIDTYVILEHKQPNE